jgi:transcription antitermination factor NusG
MNSCSAPEAPWVAVRVRPRAERKIQAGLGIAGLETFVPWHRVRRRWSDRVKTLEENLFPGYLFCRCPFEERRLVMGQPGVEGVVSFNHQPALIPDGEIATLRRTVESGHTLGPWPFLQIGQRVRIECGVLEGLEGTLAREAGISRIVVSVNALQRSVAIQVDRDMIRPI